MVLLAIAGFKGELPRMDPLTLPTEFAQTALNAKVTSGVLEPIRGVKPVHVFPSAVQTAYLNGANWLGWASFVDVVPAPVAANRLYVTGNGAPKMIDGTTEYDLLVPAPTSAPTVALATPADPNAIQSIFFAYTYVSGFGEESQPSPLSTMLDWSQGVVVNLTAIAPAPSGRNLTKIRIYRSQTSATGATGLFFVAEISGASTTYNYDSAVTPNLQELLPSADYDPPPAGLTGITSLPNGMMAAFVGKDLYFSEPYQPHAWPEKYILTVDFEIVGLAAFGSTVAVLTRGTPYVAQGTHPDNFVMQKMEANLPCMSRRGIVDIGYAAVYPSADGLVVISATEANMVTRGMFSRDQWAAMSPDSFTAANYDGLYMFTHTMGDYDLVTSGVQGVDPFPADFLIGGTPATASPTGIAYSFGSPFTSFGEQRVGSIDVSGQTPYFLPFSIVQPRAMVSDIGTGDLFILESDGLSVARWDDKNEPSATARWRSKRNRLPYPGTFAAIMVRTAGQAASDASILVEVFADGRKIHASSRTNRVERMRSGVRAHDWEVEITSTVPIASVKMAGSVEELMGAP